MQNLVQMCRRGLVVRGLSSVEALLCTDHVEKCRQMLVAQRLVVPRFFPDDKPAEQC